MEQKINIAELLKDCPKGMELDCTMIDNVVFEKLDVRSSHHPIIIRRTDSKDSNTTIHLTKYGQYSDEEDYKCIIFPKGKTTWEGFHRPFKDGDVCYIKTENFEHIFIFKVKVNEDYNYIQNYVDLSENHFYTGKNPVCYIDDMKEIRLATEEEKQKLFNAIKANGYKWNEETKTLEKLPKFKVGDKIKNKYTCEIVTVKRIYEFYYIVAFNNTETSIDRKLEEHYELIPKFDINTLKPFDKVLVRDHDNGKWVNSIYGVYNSDNAFPYECITGTCFNQCIPYESNKHLLGTTNDCDEYFKTW